MEKCILCKYLGEICVGCRCSSITSFKLADKEELEKRKKMIEENLK